MIDLAPPSQALVRRGIRAELTARTEMQLLAVRGELAEMGEYDLDRPDLEEQAAELAQLLDDLEEGLPSPAVLMAAARLRA